MRGKLRIGKKATAKKDLRAFGYGRAKKDGRQKRALKDAWREALRCDECEYGFVSPNGRVICEYSGACRNR